MSGYNQTNIRAVVRELVETTPDRPGRQYLLVDVKYVEELADIVGSTIGSRSRNDVESRTALRARAATGEAK